MGGKKSLSRWATILWGPMAETHAAKKILWFVLPLASGGWKKTGWIDALQKSGLIGRDKGEKYCYGFTCTAVSHYSLV